MSDYSTGNIPSGRVPYARVRFDAIPEAWGLFQQQMGTWIVATIIMLAVLGAAYAVWAVLFAGIAVVFGGGRNSGPPSDAAGIAVFMSVIILIPLLWLVGTAMMGGMLKMAIRQVKGEPISAGDIFSVFETLPSLLGSSIIVALAVMAGAILCIIPAYIVRGMLMLAFPLVVDQKAGAMESVSRSWEALKEDMLMATLFDIVLGIVASLGMIACGIGLLFTFPLFPLAIAIVYRDYFLGPAYGANAYTPPPTCPPPPPPDLPSSEAPPAE